ncbi:MAG TPA: NAD-dependent epimerase/dehydratase family protein [Solirubrobacteraceae bacterium]|jgi:nucleoside-diphosphate-sugar epimerase|nr:NAD-dependent epimerase/dehydratase family protein [Solirubrobacteraceae bacterium]
MPPQQDGLVVAVTGPTGTFGHGLLPLLEAEPRVRRVVGIARRPFDPSQHGWSKMEYRRGDVRDRDALVDAFAGVDAVVHLAFLITGTGRREDIRQVNVEGTRNTFEAAREAGVNRFVYASSVAAYGFHPDNPIGMTEDWPVRPAARLFYAQEKAELEQLLAEEAAASPRPELYLLRPPIVLGPHAAGAKATIPEPLTRAALGVLGLAGRLKVPIPALAANVPMQFIHEADVGQALLRCVLGDGPPGAYNIAGDGVVTGSDVIRELGLMPMPIPAGAVYAATRTLAQIPWPGLVPPAAEWVEAFSHPAIMDTSKARQELGWSPGYSGIEALRDTLPQLGRS